MQETYPRHCPAPNGHVWRPTCRKRKCRKRRCVFEDVKQRALLFCNSTTPDACTRPWPSSGTRSEIQLFTLARSSSPMVTSSSCARAKLICAHVWGLPLGLRCYSVAAFILLAPRVDVERKSTGCPFLAHHELKTTVSRPGLHPRHTSPPYGAQKQKCLCALAQTTANRQKLAPSVDL